MKYYFTPSRIAKIRNADNMKFGENVEQWELLFFPGGNAKCTATLEDSLVVSYRIKYTLTLQSSSHTPWYLPKGTENLDLHIILHLDVYSICTYNCQKLEVTKMSISR